MSVDSDYEQGPEEASEVDEKEVEGVEDEFVCGTSQLYRPDEVNAAVFEELQLHPDMVRAVEVAWPAFLKATETSEAAGDALCAAIFEASPTMQSLFKTPRAVFALKLVGAMTALVQSLGCPVSLKLAVETLAFQHLQVEVTLSRVAIFRDALAELMTAELGQVFNAQAMQGFRTLLNYVGGAIIYVRNTYSDRFRLIATSWEEANRRRGGVMVEQADMEFENSSDSATSSTSADERTPKSRKFTKSEASRATTSTTDDEQSGEGAGQARKFGQSEASKGTATPRTTQQAAKTRPGDQDVTVPKTFPEMFRFNAAVMGFGNQSWMGELLAVFDTIVCNVANASKLQEECDVLALKMSKYRGAIRLRDFQTVMLASLRSLVPETWSSEHEVSWMWLWDNIERLLQAQLEKPAKFGRALMKMLQAFDERDRATFRHDIFETFFATTPAGQEHFKQSTTRLNFIVDKVLSMSLELYQEPEDVVFRLGALGLRHVGYGVPAELFGPFVSSAVEVAGKVAPDAQGLEALRWSLSLISRILMRVVSEGSTIVMRAINANNAKQLRQAAACAPRKERPEWMLSVAVGSESISPLMWAIEQGNLEAADAILRDLLTIRADRDKYYFGVDALFARHPDIVRHLCADAPALLWTLFDGLVWRSRNVEGGKRRAAYFCKHLLIAQDGRHASVLKDVCQFGDPKLICHPMIAEMIDLVWEKIAKTTFLLRNAVLIMTLLFYTLSQGVLQTGDLSITESDEEGLGLSSGMADRLTIFLCRAWVYFVFLPTHASSHYQLARHESRIGHLKKIGCFRIPAHFENHIVCYVLIVVLCAMLIFEPVLRCLHVQQPFLTQHCAAGEAITPFYTIPSMLGALTLYAVASDLCVFSNRIAAFFIVFNRLMSELFLSLIGFAFLLLAFGTAAATLRTNVRGFDTLLNAALTLVDIVVGTVHSDDLEAMSEVPMLKLVVTVFFVLSAVYLLNLLIAQLATSYHATVEDMIGLARLRRCSKVVEEMEMTSRKSWNLFVRSLCFDIPVRFCEGDNGMVGALEVMERADASTTNIESICRFGGTTSPDAAWPEEESARTDTTEDRLEKIEGLIRKLAKQQNQSRGRQGRASGGSVFGVEDSVDSFGHSESAE